MFLDPKPPAAGFLSDADRAGRCASFVSGATMSVTTALALADGTPATPDSCALSCAISTGLYAAPLWTGGWGDGAEYDGYTGLTTITVPADVAAALRRGSYRLAAAAGAGGPSAELVFEAWILVDYAPTSPHRTPPPRQYVPARVIEAGDVVVFDANGKAYRVVATVDEFDAALPALEELK